MKGEKRRGERGEEGKGKNDVVTTRQKGRGLFEL